MHSVIWAHASGAMDVYAEPPPPFTRARAAFCQAEGCGLPLGLLSGEGGDYCRKHYNALRRYGHLEGAKAAGREALHAAAHACVGRRDRATLHALASAAGRYAEPRMAGFYGTEAVSRLRVMPAEVVELPALLELAELASAFADFDAEAPLADFERAQVAYEKAAIRFARQLLNPTAAQEAA